MSSEPKKRIGSRLWPKTEEIFLAWLDGAAGLILKSAIVSPWLLRGEALLDFDKRLDFFCSNHPAGKSLLEHT